MAIEIHRLGIEGHINTLLSQLLVSSTEWQTIEAVIRQVVRNRIISMIKVEITQINREQTAANRNQKTELMLNAFRTQLGKSIQVSLPHDGADFLNFSEEEIEEMISEAQQNSETFGDPN